MIDILAETKKIQLLIESQLWYKKIMDSIPIDQEKVRIGTVLVNRAVGMYLEMSSYDEKKIFEQLLKEIDVFTLADYQNLVNKCYVELRRKYPKLKEVYIIPLLKTKDTNSQKVKSGLFVSYLFNTYQFSLIDEIEGMKNIKVNIRRYLNQKDISNISENDTSMIVFVDDFIGTGRSASSAYNNLKDSCSNMKVVFEEKVCIISLIILDIGLKKLTVDDGLTVIFGAKHMSLSSKNSIDTSELEFIKEVISKMSGKLGVRAPYLYGYGDSLSTVVTIRTPNNDIPFLWSNKSKKIMPMFKRNE